jgi:hypothetical protein
MQKPKKPIKGITPLHAQAVELLTQLEKERGGQTIYLGRVVKGLPTTKTILGADAELQIAIIRHVIRTFASVGSADGPNANYWWADQNVPWGSAEIVRLLLRRQLPFSDAALAECFEQLLGIGLSMDLPFMENLVGTVERLAANRALSRRLRKAVARVGDALVGENLSPAAARLWSQEEWGPDASARKLSARIKRMLAGPLDLN